MGKRNIQKKFFSLTLGFVLHLFLLLPSFISISYLKN
ncbi:hypothetical protein BVRB_1g022350 [Beta vulgaris subsp. vulgaris]|nr:hypothetical protein BVRB_1g022350 [Beta vulgaris subsp. vulgaris]